jgi:hypothetical protein
MSSSTRATSARTGTDEEELSKLVVTAIKKRVKLSDGVVFAIKNEVERWWPKFPVYCHCVENIPELRCQS